MVTSVFFNNYAASGEQRLIEDLIVESIRIHGQDMFYLPRTTVALDDVENEDTLREYITAIPFEFYIRSVEGFGGQGDFLSKFNVEVRDTVNLVVARKTFTEEVTQIHSAILRPREGDLVYFPLNGKIFEIKFVEHEAIFYQIGSLQIYELRCELFEYSSEVFRTGIAVIDDLQRNYSLDETSMGILTQNGLTLLTESGSPIIREEWNLKDKDPQSDNAEIQAESDEILVDWSPQDPFSQGNY